jgi:oligosaccharide repeat unit polymerase
MGASFAWGNRGNIAYILIAGALSWHVLIAPLRPIRVLIGAAILFVALFAMGNLREARLEALTGTPYSERSLTRSLSNSLHLAEFDALSLAIKDAGSRYELREGADFRNGILAMVPRQILPEREIFNVGGWFRQVYEPGKVNGWPVTVIGDWFVNFGWIGVVLGAALSGAVAGLFDSAYSRVSSRTWDAVLAPVLGILILKGGVGTGAPQQIVLTLIPLAILSLALRLRGKTGRASARWRSGEA